MNYSLPSCCSKPIRPSIYLLWAQKVLLHKIMIVPLMSHGLFYRCPYNISGPWMCQLCFCLCRVRKLSDFIKTHVLCSEGDRRSYRFETTWGSVINENRHSWVNYPFNFSIVSYASINLNLILKPTSSLTITTFKILYIKQILNLTKSKLWLCNAMPNMLS